MLNGIKKHVVFNFVDNFLVAAQCYENRTAIIFEDQSISYRELHTQVLLCAQQFKSMSIEEGAAILLCIPRSISLIVAMIGCQYCGIPYIPIDFRIPAQRLLMMTDALNGGFVVYDPNLPLHPGLALMPSFVPKLVFNTNTNWDRIIPSQRIGSETYRIFTSGSTGEPKAVKIKINSSNNLLDFFNDLLIDDSNHKVLSGTSPGFDIFFLEYALPLSGGNILILASERQASSPQDLARLLMDYSPTIYQSTPSSLKCLLPYLSSAYHFKNLLVGGEMLGQQLSAILYARADKVYNVYGPTETTVWSSIQSIGCPGEQKIGSPIQNTVIDIVDDEGLSVAMGTIGRIIIGGIGLALGYFGNTHLNTAKFIYNESDSKWWFHTGDMGYIDKDGKLNYVARDEEFIKINGHRVDPVEIVDALESLPFIEEAAVIPLIDHNEIDSLVAFIKLSTENKFTDRTKESITYLSEILPRYMVPRFIRQVDSFTRTPNGKLDQKALRNLMDNDSFTGKTFQTAIQNEIAALLSKYININHINEYDNFFSCGLTSMHAVSFHLELLSQWPQVELFQIFENPTLISLNNILEPMASLAYNE
ncbi:MAG: AMP-binding protein [Legionella sp.]|nr:AMP-binding protein [Legionella sp.]